MLGILVRRPVTSCSIIICIEPTNIPVNGHGLSGEYSRDPQ